MDVKYYADGENGIRMQQDLQALRKELGIIAFKGEEASAKEKAKK